MGKAFHHETHHVINAGAITEAPNEAAVGFSKMDDVKKEAYLSKTNDLEKLNKIFATEKDDFTKLSIAKKIASLNKKKER